MKTVQEHESSLRGLSRNAYLLGERIDDPTSHPILRPAFNSLAMTYQLAQDSPSGELMRWRSTLDGREVNCFTALHASKDDLIRKVQVLRLLGQTAHRRKAVVRYAQARGRDPRCGERAFWRPRSARDL